MKWFYQVARPLVVGVVGLTFAMAGEKVTLKNGKEYVVETDKDGLPLMPQSDKVDSILIIPRFMPAREYKSSKPLVGNVAHVWMVRGRLRVKGRYMVTVSSPFDGSIQAVFPANGEAEFGCQGIEMTEAPAAWEWLEEPGDSWFALTLTFTELDTKESFEVTRWLKFKTMIKAKMKESIRKVNSRF